MRPMVKKLCEHCLEDNDIYFVKTEHDKIFINDNYQGLFVLDMKFNCIDHMQMDDELFIYEGFVHDEEVFLHCAENNCIIYVSFKKRSKKIVNLPNGFMTSFNEVVRWTDKRVDLICGNGRFYRVDFMDNKIHKVSCPDNSLTYYEALCKAMEQGGIDRVVNWKSGYGYKKRSDRFDLYSVRDGFTGELDKSAYHLYEKDGVLAGVGEEKIEVLYRAQKTVLTPKRGYYFIGFDGTTVDEEKILITIQSDKQNCKKNRMTLFII